MTTNVVTYDASITGSQLTGPDISTVVKVTKELMDSRSMNRLTVDHKVQEQELLRIKETDQDFATQIKQQITRTVSERVVEKISFTKRHDAATDVHHFIGRVWVFTDEELKDLLKEAQRA